MREIKFRGWDIYNKKMISLGDKELFVLVIIDLWEMNTE